MIDPNYIAVDSMPPAGIRLSDRERNPTCQVSFLLTAASVLYLCDVHSRYQGDMNRQKRDQAVRVFMAKDKAQIMLMSLKCGGVGLSRFPLLFAFRQFTSVASS